MIILQDKIHEATNPQSIAHVLQAWIATLDTPDRLKEHFFVVLLNARMRVMLIDVVSVGTLSGSMVHPREVFMRAIPAAASAFLIAHNHPSGVGEPSDADIEVTKRLCAAGELIGIELVDHIILATSGYCSFKERGMLT